MLTADCTHGIPPPEYLLILSVPLWASLRAEILRFGERAHYYTRMLAVGCAPPNLIDTKCLVFSQGGPPDQRHRLRSQPTHPFQENSGSKHG